MHTADLSASDAITSLYRSHHPWLQTWLRRKLKNDQEAADLAQDTFVRLMLSKDALQLHEPRAFLVRIAHGLVVNYWRRLTLERAYLEALAAAPLNVAPSPEQRALVMEALLEIDAMLHRMPTKVREAFLLAQLSGFTYAEIGVRLGVSERMVKKYMAQAMFHCLMVAGSYA